MNKIVLHINKQKFFELIKREFKKKTFDYDYRVNVSTTSFKLRMIGKILTKGIFVHAVLIGKVNELDDTTIALQIKYNISETGYIIIILILISILFDYRSIIGLPIAIIVLAGMYYPQYRKLKNEFKVFCNPYISYHS